MAWAARKWRERHRRRGKSLAKVSARSLNHFKLSFVAECESRSIAPAESVMDIVDAVLEHKASSKTVVRMGLRRRGIDDATASALGAALMMAPVVREFDLRDNAISLVGAQALRKAMDVHRTHAAGEDVSTRRKSLAAAAAEENAAARALAPAHYLCKVQLDGNPVAADEAAGFMLSFEALQAKLVVDEEKLRLRRVFRDAVRRYPAPAPLMQDGMDLDVAILTHHGLAKSAKTLKVSFKAKEVQARLAAVAEAQGVGKLDVAIDADDFEAVLAPHMVEFRRIAFKERRATEAAAKSKILAAFAGKGVAGKAALGRAGAMKFAQKIAARRLAKANKQIAADGVAADNAGGEVEGDGGAELRGDGELGGEGGDSGVSASEPSALVGGAPAPAPTLSPRDGSLQAAIASAHGEDGEIDPVLMLLPGEEGYAQAGGGGAMNPSTPDGVITRSGEGEALHTAARLPSMDEVASALNDALESTSGDEGVSPSASRSQSVSPTRSGGGRQQQHSDGDDALILVAGQQQQPSPPPPLPASGFESLVDDALRGVEGISPPPALPGAHADALAMSSALVERGENQNHHILTHKQGLNKQQWASASTAEMHAAHLASASAVALPVTIDAGGQQRRSRSGALDFSAADPTDDPALVSPTSSHGSQGGWRDDETDVFGDDRRSVGDLSDGSSHTPRSKQDSPGGSGGQHFGESPPSETGSVRSRSARGRGRRKRPQRKKAPDLLLKLDCSTRQLSSIDGLFGDASLPDVQRNWSALQTLDLSANFLYELTMPTTSAGTPLLGSLTQLDLSRNQIVDTSLISLDSFPQLRCLSLAHNRIERIAPGTFDACSEMVEIVLADNGIRSIGGALIVLTKLHTVDLSNNAISKMGTLRTLAMNKCFRTLWLDGNPICSKRTLRPQMIAMFPALEFYNGVRLPRLRSTSKKHVVAVESKSSPMPRRGGKGSRNNGRGGSSSNGGGGRSHFNREDRNRDARSRTSIADRVRARDSISRDQSPFELCVLAFSAERIERPKQLFKVGASTTLRRPQLPSAAESPRKLSDGNSTRSSAENASAQPGDASSSAGAGVSDPFESTAHGRARSGCAYELGREADEPQLYIVLRYGEDQSRLDAPVIDFRTRRGKRKKLLKCACVLDGDGTALGGGAKRRVRFPHFINRSTPLEIALWEKSSDGGDRLWATSTVRPSQVPLHTQHTQSLDLPLTSLIPQSDDAPKGGLVSTKWLLANKQQAHITLSVVRRRTQTMERDNGRESLSQSQSQRLSQSQIMQSRPASPAWKQTLSNGDVDVLLELTKKSVAQQEEEDDELESIAHSDYDDYDGDGGGGGGGEEEEEEEAGNGNKRQKPVASATRLAALSGPRRKIAKHATEHLRTVVGFGSKFSPAVKKSKWNVKPPVPPPTVQTPLARTADFLAGQRDHFFAPANLAAASLAAQTGGDAAHPASPFSLAATTVADAVMMGKTHHLLLRNRALEWIEDLRHRSTTVQTALEVLLRMADSRHSNGGASTTCSSRLGGALARFGRQLRDFAVLNAVEIPDVVYRAIELDEAVVLSAGRAPYTALGAMVDDVVAEVHTKQALVIKLQMALNDEASASMQNESTKFDVQVGNVLGWKEAAALVDEICASIRATTVDGGGGAASKVVMSTELVVQEAN